MASKYEIFCKVVENKSFTKTADEIGYTQSAVSQIIKTMERDLDMILIDRAAPDFVLTPDGYALLPYFTSIYNSEKALIRKQKEIYGMYNSTIKIGTFTSVSRTILPPLLHAFKKDHPNVQFILMQGTYSNIMEWIENRTVDFGFVIEEAVSGANMQSLFHDEMLAVFPEQHPLAGKETISLSDLADCPMILVDEGDYSVPLAAFEKEHLIPKIEYKVYDDYSILAMIRQDLAVAMMYDIVIKGFEEGLVVRHIEEKPERTIALSWKNLNTMPYASRKLAESILDCSDFSIRQGSR